MNFKLTQFLKFCEDERDYFLLLVEVAKSESKEYKNLLFEKMKILKQTNDSLAIRSKRNQFVFDSKDIFYFSNWLPATIHLLTSIPKLQTSLAISKKLNLHEDHVIQILKYLLSQNFVTFDGKNWKYKSGEIHLNKESPLFYFHHQNWRSKAITQAQSDLEGIHGTYIYTLKTGDIEKIKSLILKLISDLSEIAGPSEPEECVAFTCDFFKV